MKKTIVLIFFLFIQACATTIKTGVEPDLLVDSIMQGRPLDVKQLLEKGSDPNSTVHLDTPLLSLAIELYQEFIARQLIDAGANVNAQDEFGNTPMHWAARKGRPSLLKHLLKAGAQPQTSNRFGATPLHWAAKSGNLKAIKLLVVAGASLDATDRKLRTPLHWAYRFMQLDAAWSLEDLGADQTVKDKDQLTPPKSSIPEVVFVIETAGRHPNKHLALNWMNSALLSSGWQITANAVDLAKALIEGSDIADLAIIIQLESEPNPDTTAKTLRISAKLLEKVSGLTLGQASQDSAPEFSALKSSIFRLEQKIQPLLFDYQTMLARDGFPYKVVIENPPGDINARLKNALGDVCHRLRPDQKGPKEYVLMLRCKSETPADVLAYPIVVALSNWEDYEMRQRDQQQLVMQPVSTTP
jgi:hypothetical protein